MLFLIAEFITLPRIIMAHRFAPECDYDTGYRTINWLELVYVEQGDWTYDVQDHCRFTAHSNDFFVCVPNIPSRCQTKPGGQTSISCSIALLGDFEYSIIGESGFEDFKYRNNSSQSLFKEKSHFILPFHYTPDNQMKLEEKFNAVIKEFNQPGYCSQYVLNGHAMLLMADITNSLLRRAGSRETSGGAPGTYLHVRKIMDYLYNHYTAQLDLRSLSDHMGLHPNYICNIFKKATQQTLTECLNKIRIEKAKQLLLNTKHHVNAICSLVGIENEQYFGKLFKRMEGITPKQYRYFGNRLPD